MPIIASGQDEKEIYPARQRQGTGLWSLGHVGGARRRRTRCIGLAGGYPLSTTRNRSSRIQAVTKSCVLYMQSDNRTKKKDEVCKGLCRECQNGYDKSSLLSMLSSLVFSYFLLPPPCCPNMTARGPCLTEEYTNTTRTKTNWRISHTSKNVSRPVLRSLAASAFGS